MNRNTVYIVKRDGFRVSETEHQTEEEAKVEASYWKTIVERYQDGTKISICKKSS
jgi:hypothetical protein